jgi:hypothetical protein
MDSSENKSQVNSNGLTDNKIYVGVIGAVIVVLCFFMPWIEIDCMGKKSMSGADIGGILWAIPIGAAIFIFAFFSFYKRKEIGKIVTVGLINFFGSWAILSYRYFVFEDSLKKELGYTPEKLGISVKYGAAITVIGEFIILIGTIILAAKSSSLKKDKPPDSNEVISQIEKLGKLKEQNLITEAEFNEQKANILNSSKNEPAKLPTVDFTSNIDSVKSWFNKYRKNILLSAGTAIVLLIVYFAFIKTSPESDAKKSASYYEDCQSDYESAVIKVNNDFLDSFSSANFKNRQEARKKLEELMKPVNDIYNDCLDKARKKHDEYRLKYDKDKKDIGIFDKVYGSYESKSKYESEYISSNEYVSKKINTLIEPEPDAEKIKNDLIGQKMTGWNFSYLSEFKKIEIIKTNKNDQRLEHTVKLDLLDEKKNSSHEAEVVLVYLMADIGWVFDNVSQNYITYDNVIPDDNWIKIFPFENCKFFFDNKSKTVFKTDEYSQEINMGPDVADNTIPYSKSYLIKSREGHPVTMRFTYRPK